MAYYWVNISKNFWEVGSDGYNFAVDPSTCLELDSSGALQPAVVPKLNRREIGRKVDCGQEFTNRWVFGKKAAIEDSNGGIGYLAYQSDCVGGLFTNGFEPVKRSLNSWDGQHVICLWMAKYPGGLGTRTYWRVYCDCWIIDSTNITNPPTRPGQSFRVACKRLNKSVDYTDDSEGTGYALASAYYDQLLEDSNLPFSMSTWGTVRNGRVVYCIDAHVVPAEEPKFSRNAEYWADSLDLGVGAGKTFSQLISEAYMDAFSGLPDLSGMGNAVNAIQLVSAGLSIGKALFTGDALDSVGSVSDAWLAYRYSYGTTKSDIMEVASYFSRAADLISTDVVHANGTANLSLGADDSVLVRCSIEVGLSELSPLKSTIEKYGLQLDGYAMWDMVPYSFIADWFLGVGDALERARLANFARRLKKGCWCSLERRWVNEYGFREIYYHRVFTHPGVSYLTIQQHGTKGTTIVKRALDTLALFL